MTILRTMTIMNSSRHPIYRPTHRRAGVGNAMFIYNPEGPERRAAENMYITHTHTHTHHILSGTGDAPGRQQQHIHSSPQINCTFSKISHRPIRRPKCPTKLGNFSAIMSADTLQTIVLRSIGLVNWCLP